MLAACGAPGLVSLIVSRTAPFPYPMTNGHEAARRAGSGSARGIRIPGSQPGQLRVDVAYHRPDLGDPRVHAARVRALTVGVELVDRLGNAPESELVYRTHRRRLSGRRRPRARFRQPSYPQGAEERLWTKIVDNTQENPRDVFLPHSRWITFPQFSSPSLALGRPFPQLFPQPAHNVAGVFAHLVHTRVHRVTWCPARRADKMSEPSARTVSGYSRYVRVSATGQPRYSNGGGRMGERRRDRPE